MYVKYYSFDRKRNSCEYFAQLTDQLLAYDGQSGVSKGCVYSITSHCHYFTYFPVGLQMLETHCVIET